MSGVCAWDHVYRTGHALRALSYLDEASALCIVSLALGWLTWKQNRDRDWVESLLWYRSPSPAGLEKHGGFQTPWELMTCADFHQELCHLLAFSATAVI